jgi:hypothetical protein
MSISLPLARIIATYAAPPPKGRGRVLDTSAGSGDALRLLGTVWNCDTYGTETNPELVSSARVQTTRVLRDDFADVRISRSCMSAVLVRLSAARTDLRKKRNSAILRKAASALAPGGLLVAYGPPQALDTGTCTALLHAASVRLVASHRTTSTVVVLAVRQAGGSAWSRPAALRKAAASGSIPEIGPADAPIVTLPALQGRFTFGASYSGYEDLIADAAEHGVWTRPELDPILLKPAEHTPRPLMPLRKGHLSLLLAGGMFDNLVIRGMRGEKLVVRGHVLKVRSTVESTGARAVEAERFSVAVSVLDLRTGALRILSDESET